MEATGKIARPYAIAAYLEARERGEVDAWSGMLDLLAEVVRDPQVAVLIGDPRVESGRLAKLVIDVCGEHLSEPGRNFVRLLAHNRRLAITGVIAELFTAERKRDERRSEVRVTSAFALDAGQTEGIAKAMRERLGTDVEISVDVDESLIGGVVVRAGDLVIDASVRGQLQKLASRVA